MKMQRVIPMLFKGSGDCSAIDWTFLGLTIANWSFLNFMLILALCLGVLLGVIDSPVRLAVAVPVVVA